MKTKLCSKCKKNRPVSWFAPDKQNKSGLKSQCRKCVSDAARKRYWDDPDFHRERTRRYVSKNRELYNANRRMKRAENHITESSRKYGVSKCKIKELLEIKTCQICGIELSMSAKNTHHKHNIDHCHKTGTIRGVLCGYCNNMIGRANDSVEILYSAIKYLKGEK